VHKGLESCNLRTVYDHRILDVIVANSVRFDLQVINATVLNNHF
jgi:hypothetical protein